MKGWDYSDLSHMAKQAGGPAKLLSGTYNNGLTKGQKIGIKVGAEMQKAMCDAKIPKYVRNGILIGGGAMVLTVEAVNIAFPNLSKHIRGFFSHEEPKAIRAVREAECASEARKEKEDNAE